MDVLYLDNDMVLQATVSNGLTSTAINSATVTATVLDATGTAVTLSTGSWPVTLSYVSASSGVYRGTLPYHMGVVDGDSLTAHVTIAAGTGLHAEFYTPLVVRKRT